MVRIIALLAILVSIYSFGQFTDVRQIPDPKSSGSTKNSSNDSSESIRDYVSNPDYIISSEDELAINKILTDLEINHSFQVAFVAVNSIGNNVIEDFAVDLFAEWGIGNTDTDNGLLVLFVQDQRLIRFETGEGTSTILPDTKCYAIQQQYMIPYFKNFQYSTGLLMGAQAINDALEDKIIESTGEDYDVSYEELSREWEAEEKKRRAARNRSFLIGLSAWHGVGLIIFIIALIYARLKHDPYAKYSIVKWHALWIWALIFPVTHIFVVILAKKLKTRYRDMIRFSDLNGEIMHKLTETEEDKFLSKGQITEELVRSIDYDVWITEKSEDVLILPYKKLFSGYTKCPSCKFKTYKKLYDKILKSPTYSSAGQGERKYSCSNCKHSKTTKYRIAKLVRSSTTSSSRSGWSSSRSGGYSGGGGSSWGGGSSSGGGATSGW